MKNQFYPPTEDDWQMFFTTPIFAGSSPSMITQTISASQCRRFQAGETIISQGQPALAFHLILDGKVMVYREHSNGGRSALRTAISGDVLGLPAAAGQEGEYPYTCIPLTGSRSQVFPREVLASLLANKGASTSTILQYIKDDQIEDPAVYLYQRASAQNLVARYIIQRLSGIGADLADQMVIQLSLRPLAETAGLIGISEADLSRTIADFDNQNMIKNHHDCITICNLRAIKRAGRTSMESTPLAVSNG